MECGSALLCRFCFCCFSFSFSCVTTTTQETTGKGKTRETKAAEQSTAALQKRSREERGVKRGGATNVDPGEILLRRRRPLRAPGAGPAAGLHDGGRAGRRGRPRLE